MFRFFLIISVAMACNNDDGKIDETCDEIPEPCHWETAEDEDTGDA